MKQPVTPQPTAATAPESLRTRFGPEEPTDWTNRSLRPLDIATSTRLCQLRTNACAWIGGHLIGGTTCTACLKPVGRGANQESMVQHLFLCRNGYWKRRQFGIKTPADLWRKPRACLDFAAWFRAKFPPASDAPRRNTLPPPPPPPTPPRQLATGR